MSMCLVMLFLTSHLFFTVISSFTEYKELSITRATTPNCCASPFVNLVTWPRHHLFSLMPLRSSHACTNLRCRPYLCTAHALQLPLPTPTLFQALFHPVAILCHYKIITSHMPLTGPLLTNPLCLSTRASSYLTCQKTRKL